MQSIVEIEKRPSTEKLLELFDPKNPELLKELGGAKGLAEKLHSCLESGLGSSEKVLEEQKQIYGDNILPEPVSHTLLEFVWEALQDRTLIVLMVAGAVEMAIGIYKIVSTSDALALIDGGAIICASKFMIYLLEL